MQKKRIIQYTKDGEELRRFDSICDAQAAYHITHISSVCRGRRKSDGGFIWRYEDAKAPARQKD